MMRSSWTPVLVPVLVSFLLVPGSETRAVSCVSSSPLDATHLLITGLHCHLQRPHREARQAWYGDTDVPLLKVDPNSLEGAKIAEQISALFREGGADQQSDEAGFAAINRVNMTVRGDTDPIR